MAAGVYSLALWAAARPVSFGAAYLLHQAWPQESWWLSGTNTLWRPSFSDIVLWTAFAAFTIAAVYLAIRLGAPPRVWLVVTVTHSTLLALAAIFEALFPLPGGTSAAVAVFAWGTLLRTALIVAGAAVGSFLAQLNSENVHAA